MNKSDELQQQCKVMDFSDGKPAHEIPALKARIEKKQRQQAQLLENDVLDWLMHQDIDTRKHVNAVIRHVKAVKSVGTL